MIAPLAPYLTDWELWRDLLPVPVGAAIFAALAALIPQAGSSYRHRFVVIASFSLLGFVVGDLTGQSREPAVAATIGALLTLLGGALVYLLGEHGPAKQVFVSAAVCVMALSLFFGTNWGSVLREQAELKKQSARYRFNIEQEDFKLHLMRKAAHFPDPPPAAPASTDKPKG